MATDVCTVDWIRFIKRVQVVVVTISVADPGGKGPGPPDGCMMCIYINF